MWRHCTRNDAPSWDTMQTESLTPEVLFQRIQKYFGPHDIDIFASKTNHKLNTFMCWKYCPQASSTNSFNHSQTECSN
ncbi:hypothetical protein AYI70_g11509 [Smittium culicis]|uniref:Uncharacterized protein n=1 Tax=Smittium culicis TaxID=133412 RepID=A0A1R1X1J8_9FUNG|nr:hypothetical protein AYI70_g11509 [Smittium culicis]